MTMTEDWTKEWERRVVNGVYPLRRFVGRSDHSVVFLTECKAQNVAEAAIKIMPAYPALAEVQLSHWRRVGTLSHPHLIRLLDAGRCQLGGHKFLFVVMELAEQNLGQILPGRALTADEVRDLLGPTVEALTYLHSKNLVQGGLKPPNFLVVNDRLKLACDTIRPAGERTAGIAKASLYDPPEIKNGRISTAGDIWALGITVVEALTQAPPAWSRDSTEAVALPANLAPDFVDAVQRCLNRDPAHRPAITDLGMPFDAASTRGAATEIVAPAVLNEPMVTTLAATHSPNTRLIVTMVTLGIVSLWVIWTGVHMFRSHAAVEPPAAAAPPRQTQTQPQPVFSPPAAVESPKAAVPAPLPAILHQEMPEISRSARESIRGVIKIAVRATVDRSGNVVGTAVETRGSSRYFIRSATEAAKRWKFSPAADQPSRVWLLQFEFSRAGTIGHGAAAR